MKGVLGLMETKADSTVSKKEELQELKGGGLGRRLGQSSDG